MSAPRKLRRGDEVIIPDDDGADFRRGTVLRVDNSRRRGGTIEVRDALGPWWYGRHELRALPRKKARR